MKKIIQKLCTSRLFIYFLYVFVRIYLLTISVKIENEEEWTGLVKNGKPVVICLFHQQFFFIVRFFRKYLIHSPCIMINRSRDGDIGALLAHYSGCSVVRGSSSRGGRQAMEEMVEYLSKPGRFCIHLVDGPRGPIGRVKAGAVRIAQKTGACLIPVYFISDGFWQVGSWDRFMIPKPFSRVILRFDKKIDADSIGTDREFEERRLELETVMGPYLVNHSHERKDI